MFLQLIPAPFSLPSALTNSKLTFTLSLQLILSKQFHVTTTAALRFTDALRPLQKHLLKTFKGGIKKKKKDL